MFVNFEAMTLTTDDGETYPITNMIDANGEDTVKIGEVVTVVAGDGGYWVTAVVNPITVH